MLDPGGTATQNTSSAWSPPQASHTTAPALAAALSRPTAKSPSRASPWMRAASSAVYTGSRASARRQTRGRGSGTVDPPALQILLPEEAVFLAQALEVRRVGEGDLKGDLPGAVEPPGDQPEL